VVAGFETSPQLTAGSETATQGATTQTQGQGQTVAGVQNLPSTSTSKDTSGVALLGAALMAVGGALLRRPKEQPAG
jgi:LPXTG-motif cell wall-anchored protein